MSFSNLARTASDRRDYSSGSRIPRPASAADTVKLAAITRTVFYVPLWVAMHRGFLTDEGLDVQVTFFDNAGHTDEMLRTGEKQFVLRSPEAAIMDAYRGGTLRVIAGGVSKLPHFIIAQPWIKTLDQLRGANFGVLSAKEGTTYIVQDIAKAVGLGACRLQDHGRGWIADAVEAAQGRQDRRRPAAHSQQLRGGGGRLHQSRLGHQIRAGLAVHQRQCRREMGRAASRHRGPLPARAAARPRLHADQSAGERARSRPRSSPPSSIWRSGCSPTSRNTACSIPRRRSTSRACSAYSRPCIKSGDIAADKVVRSEGLYRRQLLGAKPRGAGIDVLDTGRSGRPQ